MKSPTQVWEMLSNRIKKSWKLAFVSALVMGLLIHLPIMLSDIPNHDGLDSLYFDQNMITSGRWFLTIACGFSSYYSLPWVIGVLALLFLAVASVFLVEFLEVKNSFAVVIISGLLVAFPSLASTFAYVFTMDGYMLALALAVAAPLCVKKLRFGFVWGGLCLAFSMGTYQAYLPFAVLLSIYGIVMIAMDETLASIKEKFILSLRYLWMGILGVASYYVILQILLFVQGKELASYQGISSMGTVEKSSLLTIIKSMYADFFAFTLKGNILINNIFSVIALLGIVILFAYVLLRMMWMKKWYRKVWFYVIGALLVVGLPIATNLILVISPNVTYHLLMRYQWILYPVVLVAFIDRYGDENGTLQWGVLLTAGVLLFNYGITDNIAYSNLEKRYEKTYAYCVRLLERIEQTEGYYQGIPIAMVGVVGDDSYPITDITTDVTGGMIGISGDQLLYTCQNYKLFMANYLGATLNILPTEAMQEMYYDERYCEMGSFPAENSIQIMDGIMYVKTEDVEDWED